MPTLSNGSELDVWEDINNESPEAILFTITPAAGDVVGPYGAHSDFPYGSVDLASVDVFDGFFTVTTFTNDGRVQLFTTVETAVFDNDGNYIRTLTAQAAYRSTSLLSISADSPDDITVAYNGANEYYGGQNTQYGRHEIILADGLVQPDTFINHAPTAGDQTFKLAPGQSLDDIAFTAADADFDLLSFVIVDGPDHGALAQETRYEAGYYPFPQGQYAGSLHYHQSFLNGNLFDYVPEDGFTGTDTFTVYATDGQANSSLATITITVAAPAEAIVLTDGKDIVSYDDYDHAVQVAAMGGRDWIWGSAFDDTLDGGAGNDRLRGGAGDDTLIGGAGNDGLRGGKGDDVLAGGTGHDWLRGGSGDDVLAGGAGHDRLTGGAGSDAFVFDTAPGRSSVDRIADFRAADDEIRLDSAVFAGVTAGALDAEAFVRGRAAIDADDRVIYHKSTGRLLFDEDGSGDADAVVFATVSRGTTLTADDFSFI